MLGTFPNSNDAKRIVIDIETYDPLLQTKGVSYIYGLGYILGIGIKLDSGPSMYYPLSHIKGTNYERDTVFNYIRDLPDTAIIVGHYIHYDASWIYHEIGRLFKNYRCTLLMSQLENNARSSHSLDAMCKQLQLGEKIEIDIKNIAKLSVNEVDRYCCHDIDLTARLDDRLWQFRDTDAANREFGIIPILVQMKEKGIKIDVEQLNILKTKFNRMLQLCMYNAGTDDIWSAAKVATIFDGLGIKYPRTDPTGRHPTGNPSFPSWYLESINHPQVKALHKARQIYKIQGFCEQIENHLTKTGRLHPDFFNGRSEFGGTITGRFSSGHPNVQQMPHRTEEGTLLRSVFIPDDNHLLFKFDYKQQEPIMMLHYASKLNLADIQRWRDIYQSPDADFYIPIQEAMNISRFEAKTYSLARSYGMGAEKLSQRAHITMMKAIEHLTLFDKAVPWMNELKKHCTDKASQRGWIQTIGGRKLYFSKANAVDAFNHLIQGSAADQIKQAMINIVEIEQIPLLQIHDELLFQLSMDDINNQGDRVIEKLMQNAFLLDFPSRVDVSSGQLNWQQCG